MKLKENKKKFYAIIATGSVLGLLLIALIIAFMCFWGSANKSAMIFINKNATKEMVKDSLASHFGESFADKTMSLANFGSVDWSKRTGAYYIEKGTNTVRAMRKITRGAQTPIKFTFNNIRTLNQLAQFISSKFMMSDTEFLSTLQSPETLVKLECDSDNVISIFLPDTYELYWNTTPDKLINYINSYYTKWWTDARKAKADKLGFTPQEVSVIASIAEEETNDKVERGLVARLYMNRCQSGIKLQADPTVKFAIGDFSIRRISHEMLTTDSPYNTYKYAGLPPGPIRIPEKATLDAVLNAPEHNYTYMCAKEDFSGKHNFTSSYAEHMANARRYQKALDAHEIK